MANQSKTLVILIPGFPANEVDSTCVPFPQLFVRRLKQIHPDLNIIVLALQYPFSKSMYQWHNAEVHSFNGKNKGKISRLLLWNKVRIRIKKIMRQHQVLGILNFWLGECALVSKFAAKGLRTFTWLMGQDARSNNKYVKWINPPGDSLIALSDFITEEFYRNHLIKINVTIPPGIDTAMFTSGAYDRSIDILGAGSLIPLKQYDQFIHLIANLKKTRPDIKAMICGEGPERKKLQGIIGLLGLEQNIVLAGECDHDKVLLLMQSSKIFLHPSSYEGFSTACAEALYAGAQVVSYCKPMNSSFHHWKIAQTEIDMEMAVTELLNNKNADYTPQLTYSIDDTCNKILSLYFH